MAWFAEAALRSARRSLQVPPDVDLPAGRIVQLPGRGSTYLVDTGVPTGDPAAEDGTPAEARREGPTLFLLHALACTGLLTWYPSIPELRRRYRLVVFDQRWHGQGFRSPRFDLDDCADDLIAVADLLGVDQIVPVGFSMGSLVAQLAWRRHPSRIAGAVLGAGTASFAAEGSTPRALEVISTRVARLAERRVATGSRNGVTAAGDPDRWAYEQFRSTSAAEIAGAGAVISRFDSSGWIGRMDVPTAVVVTAKDRAIGTARQRRLAALLPASTSYEADAGHASCVVGAHRFTPALLAACASVTSRVAWREPR